MPAPFQFSISQKQKELMEICRVVKFVLASGPRYSTKSVGCLHCVADHAWRTDRGNVALVSVSQSAGLDSGIWEDLVTVILPQWMDSMGMKWVKKPYIANVTKKPACEVSNCHGNRTKITLESLKVEREVEARFKNKRYSMMYVTELSNFKQRKTFEIWGECLRMLHLKEEQHLFLGDTNPDDEGEDSWIYKHWYVMPNYTYDEYVESRKKDNLPVLGLRQFEVMQKTTKLLEFAIADNIFATQQRIDELVARYSTDPDLYDRYILGLWKKASTDALFRAVFRPNIHIIGEHETPSNPDPEILIPEESTFELITGWDPGDGINSAAVIIEKLMREIRVKDKTRLVSYFKVLDELCVIGDDHSLDDFTETFVKKMLWWEERMGRKFLWRHWSDRSVFERKEPRHMVYYHQIIHQASGGLVTLEAAERGPGSVRQRVNLWRKLLFENRAFLSKDKTPNVIEMCRTLRKGSSDIQVIAKGHKMKHPFDATMYAIGSECYEEMEEMIIKTIRTSRDEDEPPAGLVSIAA